MKTSEGWVVPKNEKFLYFLNGEEKNELDLGSQPAIVITITSVRFNNKITLTTVNEN